MTSTVLKDGDGRLVGIAGGPAADAADQHYGKTAAQCSCLHAEVFALTDPKTGRPVTRCARCERLVDVATRADVVRGAAALTPCVETAEAQAGGAGCCVDGRPGEPKE